MIREITFKNSRKEKLSGILLIPEKYKKAIIISHGFGANKEGFLKIGGELYKDNFLILLFDFSGHGDSEGEFTKISILNLIDDLKSAINYLNKYSKNIFLVGHSMGGAASLFLSSKDREIKGVCTLAAPFIIKSEKIPTNKKLEDYDDITKAYWSMVKSFSNYKEEYYNSLKDIKAPVLIMNGDLDDRVTPEEAEAVYNKIKSKKKLIILKGTDHTLFGADQDIIKNIKEFFGKI